MHLPVYDLLYYVYVLLFASYISLRTGCGTFSAREKNVFFISCPILLIFQGICLNIWGMEKLWLIYPLITHLPIVVLLLFMKAKWDTAIVAVIISYSMCQVLRWIGLFINIFEMPPSISFILHICFCHLFLLFFSKYCIRPIHNVAARPGHLLHWFGSLPLLYYVYEYFNLFTQQKFIHVLALDELLPTAMILFFILFTIAYQRELEKREQAESLNAALERELYQAAHEINILRVIEDQTAIHRHDLRHHLAMIAGMLAEGKSEQAAKYIREAENSIHQIVPARYCEHETINLLLSSFMARAAEKKLSLKIKANLPQDLNLSDTELCVLISNGLDNALDAASTLTDTSEGIDFYCDIRQGKLLMEIRNPCRDKIVFIDGIPQAKDAKKHYGCLSIQSIVQRRSGVYSFETCNGSFILRVVLPLPRKTD